MAPALQFCSAGSCWSIVWDCCEACESAAFMDPSNLCKRGFPTQGPAPAVQRCVVPRRVVVREQRPQRLWSTVCRCSVSFCCDFPPLGPRPPRATGLLRSGAGVSAPLRTLKKGPSPYPARSPLRPRNCSPPFLPEPFPPGIARVKCLGRRLRTRT